MTHASELVTGATCTGLKFIGNYDSDSDDDECDLETEKSPPCSLVNEIPTVKVKLPVPVQVTEMYRSKADERSQMVEKEDREKHCGKVRTFAYMRGNWASFVYIPFNSGNGKMVTHRLSQLIEETAAEFPDCTMHLNVDPHLSLTKTQILRHHWIENFKLALKDKFKCYQKFDITLNEFELYTNEEKTRTFFGIKVYHTDVLLRLIRDCDACLAEYSMESYYEDPSLHISLAWTLGEEVQWMRQSFLPLLNSKWKNICEENVDFQFCSVDRLELKSGNKIYEFIL